MSEFVTVGVVGDVNEGRAKAFQVRGQPVAVSKVNGELLAFSDTCTHSKCNLSDGEISGTVIECECHGSRFDMKTGQVEQGPATEPVEIFEVRDQDGELQVRV